MLAHRVELANRYATAQERLSQGDFVGEWDTLGRQGEHRGGAAAERNDHEVVWTRRGEHREHIPRGSFGFFRRQRMRRFAYSDAGIIGERGVIALERDDDRCRELLAESRREIRR